jgi:agmatinase
MHTNIPTFVNARRGQKNPDVTLLLAPYDRTASFRKGTVHGSKAILECLNYQIEFFDRAMGKDPIPELAVALDTSLNGLNKLRPEKAVPKVTKAYEQVLKTKSFPVLLGGEHSMTIGALQALSTRYAPKDVTIIHIDAHLDMRVSDADYSDNPSAFAHSTVMHHAGEMGYRIVSVGIRTGSQDEYAYADGKKGQIQIFEWNKKNRPDITTILKAVTTKYIYLSIDVDGIDPSFMPATGTPVQGGLEWYFALELFNTIGASKKLIGFDIVEVSPAKDDVRTEFGAAQICYNILARHFS